jgi:hypothetical protein
VVETESNVPPVAQVGNLGSASSTRGLSHFRKLLTNGLDDNDLNSLLLDDFRDVYRKVESNALKVAKIQALLDYVERHKEYAKLETAIREKNPTLFEEPEAELRAA